MHKYLFVDVVRVDPLMLRRHDVVLHLAISLTSRDLHHLRRLIDNGGRQMLLLTTIVSVVDFGGALLGGAYGHSSAVSPLLCLLVGLHVEDERWSAHLRQSHGRHSVVSLWLLALTYVRRSMMPLQVRLILGHHEQLLVVSWDA